MSKRKDCFFGLHFDFHASEETRGIGSEFDESILERIMRKVKPDFVQCDTKGHPGYSSYPTKVGNPAPEIAVDILRKWRDITAKYGVALYAHYSGVIDKRAAKLHPEWAAVNEKGERDCQTMSVFGEYADKLLIPQLKELALNYKLDGAWIDGDCWGTVLDYSENAKEAYRKEYGKEPPKPSGGGASVVVAGDGHGAAVSGGGEIDSETRAYIDFCRQGFLRYAEHYMREVKKAAPDFEITSNWLNGPPAPVGAEFIDYISGDYDPNTTLHTSRHVVRMFADSRRTWDLMAWGFRTPAQYVKTYEQLCQEAAAVILFGGAFQVYNPQSYKKVVRDEWAVPVWARLAEFCRARQSFCHKAEPMPEAAVVHSLEAFYHNKANVFGGWGNDYAEDAYGLTNALLENRIPCEVLLSRNVLKRDNLSEYKLLVFGNAGAVEPELKEKLLAFARGGGVLVIAGQDGVKLFADELKLKIAGTVTEKPEFEISANGMRAPVARRYVKIAGCAAGEAVTRKYGKGRIVAVPFALGFAYFNEPSSVLRDYAGEFFDYKDRKARVTGAGLIDVALMKKDGKEYVHLLNMAGEHRDRYAKTFDYIPPAHNIKIEYRCGRKPKAVTLLPENKPLKFTYNEKTGKIRFGVNKLKIHSAVEIKY